MDRLLPVLYPLNRSLHEEVGRLFSEWQDSYIPNYGIVRDDVVRTEFKLNGHDSEYCPDTISNNDPLDLIKINDLNGVVHLTTGPSSSKKKSKKKQIQGCVFCRTNGEMESYYKQHTLKDSQGRVSCPILRAYVCPICGANGDYAHTIKYCPQNTEHISLTPMKFYHNAVGKLKTKAFMP